VVTKNIPLEDPEVVEPTKWCLIGVKKKELTENDGLLLWMLLMSWLSFVSSKKNHTTADSNTMEVDMVVIETSKANSSHQ